MKTVAVNLLSPFAALSLLILFLGACQDHHWKPYDKIGPLEVQERPYSGKLVSGKVKLADSISKNDYSGWSLFVIARPAEGASMLAAVKESVTQFPVSFVIESKHIMLGKVTTGEKIMVEARLDKDGVLDTKDNETITGKSKEQYELGQDNALVELTIEPSQ